MHIWQKLVQNGPKISEKWSYKLLKQRLRADIWSENVKNIEKTFRKNRMPKSCFVKIVRSKIDFSSNSFTTLRPPRAASSQHFFPRQLTQAEYSMGAQELRGQ